MHDAMIIPMMALMIPIVVAPTAIICGLVQSKRKMEHAERMRALELGRILPQDEPWWSPARLTVAIGVMVPLASIAFAWLATESLGGHQAESIQVMAGMVGVTSVLSGGLLANRNLTHQFKSRNPGPVEFTSKPAFDPDAYDFVSRRG